VVSQRVSMDHIPENTVAPPSPSAQSFSHSRVSRRVSGQSSLSRTVTSPPLPPQPSSTEELPSSNDGARDPISRHTGGDEDEEEDEDEVEDEIDDEGDDEEDEEEGEEDLTDTEEGIVIEEAPVVQSIHKATVPQVVQKARMVSVPKRGPPPRLPPRNPNRSRGPLIIDADKSNDSTSPSSLQSPAAQSDSPDSPLAASSVAASMTPTSPKQSHHDTESAEQDTSTPDETPEEHRRDPWAKVMQAHDGNASQDSLDVPGAFHSMPTTPEEGGSHRGLKTEPEDDFS